MEIEDIRNFVSLYEENRCLWDQKHEKFFDKRIREEIWQGISKQMKMPVKTLKDKMASLMGSFRREKSREKQSDRFYKSKWFAYDWFQFLVNKDNSRPPGDSSVTTDGQACTSKQNTEADEYQREETAPRRRYIKSKAQKRANDTTELQEVQENMTNAINVINRLIKDQQKQNNVDEDEIDLYGKLLVKRLRLLSQRESQEAMYEIDGMILNRLHNQKDPFDNGEYISSPPVSPITVNIEKRSVSPCSPYTTPAASPGSP